MEQPSNNKEGVLEKRTNLDILHQRLREIDPFFDRQENVRGAYELFLKPPIFNGDIRY